MIYIIKIPDHLFTVMDVVYMWRCRLRSTLISENVWSSRKGTLYLWSCKMPLALTCFVPSINQAISTKELTLNNRLHIKQKEIRENARRNEDILSFTTYTEKIHVMNSTVNTAFYMHQTNSQKVSYMALL